ncbi:MAG: NAD(P)/FAD-dependent oxidoreductase [Candidatus Aminicenantes bacterium]|nr:NAD(P)/FAD-dependent oxidoreductase [Candidatus Aminicenantes bacterium]
MNNETTVAIIGAGPAGLSAAFQLKRFRIPFILFEKENIGGLLRNAGSVENYPGFPLGIPGWELTRLMISQAEKLDLKIIYEKVETISFQEDKFLINTSDRIFLSRFLVVASGTKAKTLDPLLYQDEVQGKIHTEIHIVRTVKDKTIGIIGGGDAAFDYSLTLSARNSVIIFNRSKHVKCIPELFERVKAVKNIEYKPERTLKAIYSNNKRLRTIFIHDGSEEEHCLDLLVTAIGREPAVDFLSKQIRSKKKRLESQGRLYFIGDVKNGPFRQLAIASGNGVECAMKINNIRKASFLNR